MKFSLGFSPCPNDTFIFDALVNRKIDTGSFEFEVVLGRRANPKPLGSGKKTGYQ